MSKSNLARQTILTTGVRFLQVLLIFGASAIIARTLGPERQGVFFVAITLATVIVQFSILGLQASNTYLLAQDKGLLPSLLTNSLLVSLLFGSVVGILVAIGIQASGWLIGTTSLCVWIAVMMVPARMFFLLGGNLLVGLQQIGRYNALQMLLYGSVFVAVATAAWLGASTLAFLIVTLITWSATAIVLFVVLAKDQGLTHQFDRLVFREGFSFGMKSYLSCLFAFLAVRMNVFLLDMHHGEAAVGQYSIAAQIWEAMLLLPQSLALVLFPTLVRETKNRWQITSKNLLIIAGVMSLACLVCALLVETFVLLAFGATYLPAVQIVWWMLPGILAYSLVMVVSQYLASIGYPKLQVAAWFASFVIITIVGMFLIPQYGGVGAAMSLSITGVATLCLQFGLTIFSSVPSRTYRRPGRRQRRRARRAMPAFCR